MDVSTLCATAVADVFPGAREVLPARAQQSSLSSRVASLDILSEGSTPLQCDSCYCIVFPKSIVVVVCGTCFT